ncbi:hypothetical protein ACU686_45260 [Yinghuangia aomiensis]
MVIGRILQGASFGVIALGMSLMRDELPPARLGPSVALMSATLGIGGAVGLPVAAVVAQNADWHMLFWGAARTRRARHRARADVRAGVAGAHPRPLRLPRHARPVRGTRRVPPRGVRGRRLGHGAARPRSACSPPRW